MTVKIKRIFAICLAFAIFCTSAFTATKSMAEGSNFPSFSSAHKGMGKIVKVTYDEQEIQMHMTASGEDVVLSLAFLLDGIRIYDKNGFNGMFEPKEEDKQRFRVTSETTTNFTAESQDKSIHISLDYELANWELSVYNNLDTEPVYTLEASDLMMAYDEDCRQTVTLCGDIKEGEEFIGLGERYSGVLLNGKTYELWNKDCWSMGTDSYVNVPLLHSNKGYSLFLNSYYGATADIGNEDINQFSFEFAGPDFELYLWTGTPLENLKAYTRLTGTSATIPEWATGYWAGGTASPYWNVKDTTDSEGNVTNNSYVVLDEVLQKYQSMGTMPTAVYAESMLKKSGNGKFYNVGNDYGIKLLGWWHADIPWTVDQYQKYNVSYMKLVTGVQDIPAVLDASGSKYFYFKEGSNQWLRVDYTHNSAELLVKKNLEKIWGKGLAGLMVDYGESIEVETTFANGKTGSEMHNLQPYYYNKAMKNAWDSQNLEDGYILFARAGSAGSQQYAALFGGDQRSTFTGLNQAIQGGISVNASGFSVWGSDIGGHRVATGIAQTEELYLRWLGFATYSPLMRAHGETMNDPWAYDTEEETSAQDAFKKYYWLRENMRTLIYSSSVQSNKDGTPMMQAMGFAFDEEGMFSIQDQYMFCNEILVAPVATEGATSRTVTFPTGNWYDLISGKKIQGRGNEVSIKAEQDETPAFLRSGSVVPMEVSSKTWKLTDAMTEEERTEILLITPSEKGEVRSHNWWKSEEESISFVSSFDGKTQVIKASEGEKTNIVKVLDIEATHIYVDGVEIDELSKVPTKKQSGYFYDDNGQLFIRLSSDEWKEIKIETEGIWDYEFSIDQPYEKVGYLDKAFDVYHYEFADNTKKSVEKILGPVKPSTLKEGAEVEYFTTQYYGSYSQGYLKPTTTSGGMAALTYKHQQFTNFEAEYEMLSTWSIFGLAFGGKEGIFPVSLDNKPENDTGVVLYMSNSGRIDIGGTITTSTATESSVELKTYSANSKFGGSANLYTKAMVSAIEPVSKPKADCKTYTVCVRVEDGWLTVWEKQSPDLYVKVKLTNVYKGGYVSLISNQTGHGAFKSFRIRSLNKEMTTQIEFDKLSSVDEIDDMFTAYHILNISGFTKTWNLNENFATLKNDFDSYYFEERSATAKKVNIDSQWFTSPEQAPKETYAETKYANGLLKPVRNKTTSSGERYSLLTLKTQKVTDFTAKVTYATTYYEYGLMVAPARTVGRGSNGLKVYVDSNGRISITGMLDVNQVEWSGNGTLTKTNYTVVTPSVSSYKSPDQAAQQMYTLVVQVKKGWVTASIEGIEGELKVKLKENFVGDYLSLYANGYSQGGFEKLELTVDKEDVVSMAGRPGAYWNNTIWKSGSSLGSDAGYLQPNHRNASDKRFTFLSYTKDTVYDFKTEVEIANNYTRYGVSVTPEGEMYSSTNGFGIFVTSDGLIQITGAIDKEHAVVSDGTSASIGTASVKTQTKLNLSKVSNTETSNTVYTLCVTHENGVLTAYVKEFPEVQLSVPTTSDYQGGVLSLYSTGNNQGGFKSWKLDTYKRSSVLWEKGSVGEDVSFTLSTDFSCQHVAAIVKYNAEQLTYKKAIAQGGIIADVRVKKEGELWVYADTSNGVPYNGQWLSIVFETSGDRSGMISAKTKVSDSKTNTRYTDNDYTCRGDVDGNQYLDIRDLVRLKKYSLDASVEIDEAKAKMHSMVDVYTDENVHLLRRKLAMKLGVN